MNADGARPPRWPAVLAIAALVAAVLLTYAEVGGFGWVRYDDPEYVRDNPAVNQGLSWAGLRWALTAAHSSNWHPLTWLSHQLDVELFELAPGGHHWSSVLFHALASVLCFLALRALTGRGVPAALVAALFALHPLRVESVAWVSERKDVLAGCAFFALLLAWARYAAVGGPRRYALALGCLALGLLAKPMLVTAPFVLLLLDHWPLRRLRGVQPDAAPAAHEHGPARSTGALWAEKLPFFLLAALAAGAALWSQRAGGSLRTLAALPLAERLANAPRAVVSYVADFVWPSGLAYFYPHPGLLAPRASPWTGAAVVAAVLVLLACVVAFGLRRRVPALFVGWYWFLGMLVPVLGIVQVGEQAHADRYAYLPLVGLQLALVYGLAELGARHRRLAPSLAVAAGVALVACGVASARQARHWRDSEALFRRALAVTERNHAAWLGLANELADRGESAAARAAYGEALALRPEYGPTLYGLGLLEHEQGDAARALALYRRACAAQPGLVEAWLNLGSLLAGAGEEVEAASAFERVLALDSRHPDAHFNLALLHCLHERAREALPHLEAAVRARPGFAAAWEKLGEVQLALGARAAARAAFERALAPAQTTLDAAQRGEAARLLAWILASAPEPELRDAPRALVLARGVAEASGRRDPRALEALAAAWAAQGDFTRAVETQEEALRLVAPPQQERTRARLERYRRGDASWYED